MAYGSKQEPRMRSRDLLWGQAYLSKDDELDIDFKLSINNVQVALRDYGECYFTLQLYYFTPTGKVLELVKRLDGFTEKGPIIVGGDKPGAGPNIKVYGEKTMTGNPEDDNTVIQAEISPEQLGEHGDNRIVDVQALIRPPLDPKSGQAAS
jgi:hypothetical protein